MRSLRARLSADVPEQFEGVAIFGLADANGKLPLICPSPARGEGTLWQPAQPAPSPLAGEGWGEGRVPLLPEDLYNVLMEARSPEFATFDAHVAASILSISFGEAVAEGHALTSATGLPPEQLNELVAQVFPNAAPWSFLALAGEVERSADEACLVDLLTRCATSRTVFEARLAAMIARRAQRPNHLWQDLGLNSRRDLSELMSRHFKPLAMRNKQDMKWKKFFYRVICAEAAYSLCTAPSCGECDDFDHCFGEETGESLLARSRRGHEAGQDKSQL